MMFEADNNEQLQNIKIYTIIFTEDVSEYKVGEVWTTHQKGKNKDVKGVLSITEAEQYLEYKCAKEVRTVITEKEEVIDERTKFRLQIASDLATPHMKRDVTERLAQDFEDNKHVYSTMVDDKHEVWIYEDGIYVPNGKSVIMQYVRDMTNKAYTNNLANEVISKIMTDTFISEDLFYNTNYPDLLAVENGILNIHTKELQPFSPDYIFFAKLPVSYNIDAKCPKILEFLHSIQLDDEKKVAFLLEIAGYCLYKKYPIHKWFLFEGRGRNGKGAYIRLLEDLLGKDVGNTSNVCLQDLEEKEYSVGELHGKLANIGGDIPSRPLRNTAKIKALTGEDKISVNRKFKSYLSFVNYSKQIFSANELPEVMDFSDGFWDRLAYLFFPVRFVDHDEYMELTEPTEYVKLKNPNVNDEMKTKEELSGFLNLALENLANLLQKGQFSYNLGIEAIKSMYLKQSDNVVAFVDDMCEKDFHNYIKKDDFREEYTKYCEKRNIAPKSDKHIKHTLQEKLGIVEKRVSIAIDDKDGTDQQNFERVLVWKGIRLKYEVES
jgi:putative DNA primase/helicase